MPRITVSCGRWDYSTAVCVVLFSCEVKGACMPGYLEAVRVWGIPCLLHVVRCVPSNRRDASAAVHARRMHAPNQME